MLLESIKLKVKETSFIHYQQLIYQQQYNNNILDQQIDLHSRIQNLINKYPNLWNTFVKNDSTRETIFNNYTNYAPYVLNNLGESFGNFVDKCDKNNWQMT